MIAYNLAQNCLGTYSYPPREVEQNLLLSQFCLERKISTNALFTMKLLLYKKIKVFGENLMAGYCSLSFTSIINAVCTSLLAFYCSVEQHDVGIWDHTEGSSKSAVRM